MDGEGKAVCQNPVRAEETDMKIEQCSVGNELDGERASVWAVERDEDADDGVCPSVYSGAGPVKDTAGPGRMN